MDVDEINQLINMLNNNDNIVLRFVLCKEILPKHRNGIRCIRYKTFKLVEIVALGYASCNNSIPLGGKDSLYSLDAQITILIFITTSAMVKVCISRKYGRLI
jgi:hypothetical protein